MAPEPFVFGKLPHRGDFVRSGTIAPLVDELDEWLQRAVIALRGRPASDTPIAFMMGRSSGILLGGLIPSRDSAGRSFPLTLGGFLSGAALTSSEIAARGPFLNAAAAGLSSLIAGADLEETVDGMRVPPYPTNVHGLATTDVFGTVPVERVMSLLTSSLGPFRQAQAPKYGLGLPMPADSARRAAGAAFWHDAVSARTPSRPATTLLWNAAPDGSRLAYFAGPATADAFAYLTMRTPADGVFDIDAGESPPASTAPTLGALLART